MSTRIDSLAVSTGGLRSLRSRRSGRLLADEAARQAVRDARIDIGDIGLLINAGLYHDRNLGEPALASLIQEDIGANPEDPHDGHHGTFSFDVANGACGLLTGMFVADGFLRAGTIDHALVVASDADPGHGLARRFPYAAAGAAVVLTHAPGRAGFSGFRFATEPDHAPLNSEVRFESGHNVLHVHEQPEFGPRAATLAAKASAALLTDAGLRPDQVDLVVASPLTIPFLDALAEAAGIDGDRIVRVSGHERVHTAALAVAFHEATLDGRVSAAGTILFVSAGAGLTAGAGLYRST